MLTYLILQETFLPFDLESAFSAGTFLAIGETWFPSLLFRNKDHSLRDVMQIMDIMISKGCLPAKARLSELRALEEMLNEAAGRCQEPLITSFAHTEVIESEEAGSTRVSASIESPALENSSLDLLDWMETSGIEELYPQPRDLTNIADTLGSWDSMDWLSNYSGF